MKTIGNITQSTTSEFQQALFLNDPSTAYEILDELLESNWYPEDAETEWTDIVVMDGKYYAAFGCDAVTVSDANLIYIEIEPTELMIKEYQYFQSY